MDPTHGPSKHREVESSSFRTENLDQGALNAQVSNVSTQALGQIRKKRAASKNQPLDKRVRIGHHSKMEKKAAIELVRGNGKALKDLSDFLRGDKQVVMVAVEQTGFALEFATKELRDDEEVVFKALECYNDLESENVFRFASDRLKNDRNFILRSLSENGFVLEFVPEHFRDDEEVVLTAITSIDYSSALHDASIRLKADRDFILKAVGLNGEVFCSVNEAFCDDEEVAIVAITDYPCAFKDVSARLRADKQFVLKAVSKNEKVLNFVSEEFKKDQEVLLAAGCA